MSETPRPPSHATNKPTAIAVKDFQCINDFKITSPGILPLAMGVSTPMVKIITPTSKPCFCKSGKNSLKGVILKTINTAAAMVTAVL